MRFKAAAIHLVLTGVIASSVALLVLTFWYPGLYAHFSGGLELLKLVIVVDLICGPLITFVVFNPNKAKTELLRDLTVVALIQIAALAYGVHTVWVARPLFLVLELDRFKVISAPQLEEAALHALAAELRPDLLSRGPIAVGIRLPVDAKERNKVTMESVQGGRDYAERPEFYVPYEGANALKSLIRAKPLILFLQKQPNQAAAALQLAAERKADISQWMYLPVVARQDWVAVLDKQGQIQGFLKGDGF